MSIGRVRNGSVSPPPAEGPAATHATGTSFQVERSKGAGVVAPTGSLAALREGTIDRAGYIDARVTDATSHLGPMAANIRETLRDRCESDPLLVDLIAAATAL